MHYKWYLLKLTIAVENVFLYEIELIAIRNVSPPFDEEQQ